MTSKNVVKLKPEEPESFRDSGTPESTRPTTDVSSVRLPSLRPKRDLTLGGVPKRVFTPTIPARRVKKEPRESEDPSVKPEVDRKSFNRRRFSDGDREKHGRRERKKEKREMIASASVFSMGPAEKTAQRRKEVESFGSVKVKKEPLTCKREKDAGRPQRKDTKFVINSDDEEEPMDVCGTEEEELFAMSSNPPVLLPLNYSLHERKRRVVPTKMLPKVKGCSDGEEMMETGSAHSFPAPIVASEAESSKVDHLTSAQLFTPDKGSKGQFLFLQFPDHFPLALGAGVAPPLTTMGSGVMNDQPMTQDQPVASTQGLMSSLQAVPEGLIGKLRVHKSGKVKLLLGDIPLDVAMGTRGGFLQELATIRTQGETPSLSVLGQLSHRLVCTPDMEHLLLHER